MPKVHKVIYSYIALEENPSSFTDQGASQGIPVTCLALHNKRLLALLQNIFEFFAVLIKDLFRRPFGWRRALVSVVELAGGAWRALLFARVRAKRPGDIVPVEPCDKGENPDDDGNENIEQASFEPTGFFRVLFLSHVESADGNLTLALASKRS